jgi:hypothetical protein
MPGSTAIGTATASPYAVTWRPMVGTYAVTAVVTDNGGLATTSASVAVSVVRRK